MDILLHHFLAWFLNSPRSVFGGALVAPGGLTGGKDTGCAAACCAVPVHSLPRMLRVLCAVLCAVRVLCFPALRDWWQWFR